MRCVLWKSCSCSSVMISVFWWSIPFSSQYRASLSANDGGTMRHLRFVWSANVLSSMVVRALGKVMWVSPVQQ